MRTRHRVHRTLWGLIGTGLLLTLYPVEATGGSVSLAWDPNPEADLAGYRVHVGGTSHTYTQIIDVGRVTTFTVPNLSDGQPYFFAVTAYDIFANESGYSSEVSSTTGASNDPPIASFTYDCSDLTCRFTDTSTDADGTVVGWEWTFEEGSSSTNQNPGHTYTSGGTSMVTLKVTDDAGATATTAQQVTVSSTAGDGISLAVVGYKVKGLQKALLSWNGSTPATVDIYRDGSKIMTMTNTGSYTDDINNRGQGTYTYQVCGQGTSICSNLANVMKFN